MEELKNFKLDLNYFNEKGEKSIKSFTVVINTIKLKNKTSFFNPEMIYELTFSLKIPDHIHSYLIGKSVPKKEDSRVYSEDFSKTINSNSIEALTTKYEEILSDYKCLLDIDKAELKKVIFFSFETNNEKYKSYYNGIELGNKTRIGYIYSIGYVSKENLRFNFNKMLINKYNHNEFYNLKFVDWSEERENFFNNIEKSFNEIISKINKFGENIDNNSIDLIINNKLALDE